MRTLLKGADILLRKENGYETLHGAYLGVDEAKIDYIGEEKPEKAYDLEKDMRGRLLAPGLINCHSHIAMTLMRGIGSGLPLQDWLFKAIFPIEDKLVREDIAAVKRAVGDKVLKVIIETCLLTDEEKEKMCDIVVEAGADFIKTSTGFSTAGATFHAVSYTHLTLPTT